MWKINNCFCWSDNWWIEDNNAWFVDGERDVLLKLNFLTNQCEFIKKIPNDERKTFRQNPRCIKYHNDIVCLTDIGQCIWIYHCEQFEKIEIKNPNGVRILINNFWIFENKLYAVSAGLKQIIEINVEERRIDNYFDLYDSNIQIAGSVRVGEKIFIVSSISNQIYEFDLITKKTIMHELSEINDKLYAICFDGDKFWLSGYNRAIYCWNKDTDSVRILNNFPDEFGIYDFTGESENILDCKKRVYDTPTFKNIKFVGKYVWFIPFKTNDILYIGVDTYEIVNLDIKEENENKHSLLMNSMAHKYLMMYIRKKRYIGIFSFKNKVVFEIDTVDLQVEIKNYLFSIRYMEEISKVVTFNEFYYLDKVMFDHMLQMADLKKSGRHFNNMGLKIYQNLIN